MGVDAYTSLCRQPGQSLDPSSQGSGMSSYGGGGGGMNYKRTKGTAAGYHAVLVLIMAILYILIAAFSVSTKGVQVQALGYA